MIDFVNHVNKCKTCGIVPEIYHDEYDYWQIVCQKCGESASAEGAIQVIVIWNRGNPEPTKQGA